ncbi:hypothetical protein D9758_012681 [Tetrapyrgos nigripes]|uniref:Uncharacterized protein n=1 Tax=Tetrapyrgos nigripes TaxID=182062 RepID=A0A8H5CWV5_9AGAR|nr:hypothetical protein D9758_012681 [Tetrapyrgos nigripes]
MFPMLFLTQALAIFISYSAHATRAASPPDSISLIFPTSNEILFNSSLPIGITDPETIFGLARIVNITRSFPNGIVQKGIVIGTDSEEDCTIFGTEELEYLAFNVSGEHTIHWNITYGLSSDPSQANSSFCGPKPFSWQTFILNKTFTVLEQDNRTGSGSGGQLEVPTATFVSQLPSEPTGSFPSGAMPAPRGTKVFGVMGVLVLGLLSLLCVV